MAKRRKAVFSDNENDFSSYFSSPFAIMALLSSDTQLRLTFVLEDAGKSTLCKTWAVRLTIFRRKSKASNSGALAP